MFQGPKKLRERNWLELPFDLRSLDAVVLTHAHIDHSGYHPQRFLSDERSTILFVGYQAAGTRGRSLLDGATELKLLGQYVPVRARIVQL